VAGILFTENGRIRDSVLSRWRGQADLTFSNYEHEVGPEASLALRVEIRSRKIQTIHADVSSARRPPASRNFAGIRRDEGTQGFAKLRLIGDSIYGHVGSRSIADLLAR